MSKFPTNIYDFSTKDILYNNIPTVQNNYYKEDRNISNNSKTRSDSLSIKNKYNSNSKNKYKVTYSNSILDNNINSNIYQNIQNKNVLIINNEINNSIGNIKEVNYYINKKGFNKNINKISNDDFYSKKINEILGEDYFNTKNNQNNKNNKQNHNNIQLTTDNNNLNLVNKSHSNMQANTTNANHKSKSKTKTITNIKKNHSNKKIPKIIYANRKDKKQPMGKNRKNINVKNNSKKNEDNSKSSKNSKKNYSFIKNHNTKFNHSKNKNNNLIQSNHYMTNTYSDEKNKKVIQASFKNKIISNKKAGQHKAKEIKKSQSQSYFKPKINDLNSNNYNNYKRQNKNKNDISYKGIIMNKKNMIKNNITKSSSHNNSTSKNSRIVCINYKNKHINNTSAKKNKMNIINNYNHFMNNLPSEYNKDQLFLQIKKLWNKLRVSYIYQEMFITLTKQAENKKQIFTNEINSLTLVINHLNKLNQDIKKRNEIINKIKLYNNFSNIEEIKKILESLRMISIDVVLDYMLFIKEVSYNILTNKFNLNDIKDFNKNYINIIKNDTNFLYHHPNLSKIFYFSKKSDPFLVHPSLKYLLHNKNKYADLPINDETLEQINKCEYFLLTEKICQYSLCNNKETINSLLFNDQDNIINNIINSDTINKSTINNIENNNVINSYSNNKENNSHFSTPIIKNNSNIDITNNNTNKYDKFCYINKITNSDINEDKQNKEKDNISNNNDLINSINKNSNNVAYNDNESDNNNSILNNSDNVNASPIPVKIKKNDLVSIDNNINNSNIEITPYSPIKDASLSSIYSSYLLSVPENIKQSFNINEDIFYYANIGIYPKLFFYKDCQNSQIKGIFTISFSHNINISMKLNKKILIVTSISCIEGEKISNILLNLIQFCKKEEIVYDSLEINLYYIKKEDGNFILDEELEKEIKSEAKFKWVRLENDGEKRKIKYHYTPNNIIIDKENSISNNNINNLEISNTKYAMYINNYVLIKYYQEQGINEITMDEYSKLFFIIYLLNKYFLLNEKNKNIEKEVENILINLKGVKLKKIVRILSEFNNVLLTNVSDFKNDYLYNDNYNVDYLNSFVDILEKNENDKDCNLENNICLNFNNICSNFNNILKIDIDGYEYNLISMNDYIIEVFKISNENKEEAIYFTKSEIENISFIFYEQNENESENNVDENSIKLLFNKVLNKILVKDSEEPIKSYKKIAIPSFSYEKKITNEQNKNADDKLKIIENDILDYNESFDFCIEKISNYNTKFSFPICEKGIDNNEIKIIKNNFVVAVLNPDLVLDYHLPSMNIYFIDKKFWLKTNKK